MYFIEMNCSLGRLKVIFIIKCQLHKSDLDMVLKVLSLDPDPAKRSVSERILNTDENYTFT